MGVCGDDYTISRQGRVVTLRMLGDIHDTETISCIADTLKVYLAKRAAKYGPLALLVDIRSCTDFRPAHVLSTIGILIDGEGVVMSHTCGSAVLINMNSTLTHLRSMFRSMYKPVRPFHVCGVESEALEFLDTLPHDSPAGVR